MPSSTIGASTDQTAESGVIRVDSQTSDTMIEGEPEAREQARVQPVGEAADEARQRDRHHGHRHQQQRRLGRAPAAHDLRPDHQRDRHRRDREAHRRDRDVGEREVAVSRRGQAAPAARGCCGPARARTRARKSKDGRRSRARPRVFQSYWWPSWMPKTSRNMPMPLSATPSQSKRWGAGGQRRDQPPGEHERDRTDRHVDEEDPLPAEPVDQHAAEDRADQRGDAGGGAPQGHRGAPAGGREDPGDDRHRLRRDHRRAEPCTTRATIRPSMLPVSPHHSDASVNTVSPAR